ncbi:MAG: RidA family protein [Candidatus Eremiobacteraeota bacterium]|nr:RidA family protein [Candidatus Eremiobacteraeota bacterium]
MEHRRTASGSPWETRVGYSRAVRAGAYVAVSGTTGTDERGAVAGPDAYTQAKKALARIVDALRDAGARPSDVVRTRIYVTDIGDWEAIARAHAEVFDAVRPAATMVEVRRLIAPDIRVEIEADAIIAG